jgi:hypothetical protein
MFLLQTERLGVQVFDTRNFYKQAFRLILTL